MNALQLVSLTVFTQRNFVAEFRQAKCDLDGNRLFCVFEPPFWGLRGDPFYL